MKKNVNKFKCVVVRRVEGRLLLSAYRTSKSVKLRCSRQVHGLSFIVQSKYYLKLKEKKASIISQSCF